MRLPPHAAAIVALALFTMGSCVRHETPGIDASRTEGSELRQGPAPEGGEAYAGVSIYALDATLTDQVGRAVRLQDLAGKVVVTAMTYTSCPAVCPRIASDMQDVERRLPDHARNGVQFVLFSLDPGRDTPEARRRFAATHHLSERWRFLAGTDDDVRDLAAVLGLKYQRTDDGEIAHSATILVLDRTGVVRYRQAGLSADHSDILAAIASAR